MVPIMTRSCRGKMEERMRRKVWGPTSDVGEMSIFHEKGISGRNAYNLKMSCVFMGLCWEKNIYCH